MDTPILIIIINLLIIGFLGFLVWKNNQTKKELELKISSLEKSIKSNADELKTTPKILISNERIAVLMTPNNDEIIYSYKLKKK